MLITAVTTVVLTVFRVIAFTHNGSIFRELIGKCP